MSRSQWCCLVAALAVALGLFCGPSTAAPTAASTPVPTAAPAAAAKPAPAPVAAAAADGGHGVPGCRGGKRDGTEPAVPGRARAAHDQAPGLAEWGLPVATGPGPVRPPAPTAQRGPDAAAPTPVELSVLRV
ncbi:hypothetical protein [Streptomyces sp. RKAG290]|uniref:hypothetical protein n=1 Tax=Streptomyces sp. RKAG290 TaxID=2888348 RepID=UPI0020339CF2|nr:hypothetical protein [Streptomyces sp. RKAG290]MCM2412783.1 hypothetical protein [Streptomyces sp. RKAG290]